jgi:hypothetical protein
MTRLWVQKDLVGSAIMGYLEQYAVVGCRARITGSDQDEGQGP